MQQIENKPFVFLDKFKNLVQASSKTRYFVYYSGRGCGKSENVAAALILKAAMSPIRILCVREFQSSIAESVKSLLEGKIEQMGLSHLFFSTNSEIRCINGSEFIFKGLRTTNAANIKSIYNIRYAWCEEAETISNESLNILLPSVLRQPGSQIIFTFNPRFVDDAVYKMFIDQKPPPLSNITYLTFEDNPFFKQTPLEEQRLHDLEVMPRSEYEHKWEGKLRKMVENALFDERAIERSRYPDIPPRTEFYRVVISCDPATTNAEYSNEYGIVVCGAHTDGTYWVLDNATALHTPHSFAVEVERLYKEWDADGCVVETNQGGDFIKATLLTQNASLNIIEVRAAKDKIQRAAPVASMFSLSKIRLFDTPHTNMKHLVAQMSKITTQGYIGPKGSSPDALDAMVWGIYELAGLSQKDTEDTLFNMKYFEKQEGFDFRPSSPNLFVGMDAKEAVCIEYVIAENRKTERRLVVSDCFVVESSKLLDYLKKTDYGFIYLPEREMFYTSSPINSSFYDDTFKEDLDHLALESCEFIRRGFVFFEDMPKHSYTEFSGELLRIALGRFKLEQKKECLFTKTFGFLINENL